MHISPYWVDTDLEWPNLLFGGIEGEQGGPVLGPKCRAKFSQSDFLPKRDFLNVETFQMSNEDLADISAMPA